MVTATQVVKNAKALVGKKRFTPYGSKGSIATKGMCEALTRTAFEEKAKYPTARHAYLASRAAGGIHGSKTPPAGVPVYFNITRGVNKNADHVAISVGNGWCVSTSVGVGGSVGLVKISDFGTKIWRGAVVYLGWGDTYHGKKVPTKASAPAKKDEKKPAPKPKQKTIAQLADEVIAGKHGNGDARKKSLGSRYAAVQKAVNAKLKKK